MVREGRLWDLLHSYNNKSQASREKIRTVANPRIIVQGGDKERITND